MRTGSYADRQEKAVDEMIVARSVSRNLERENFEIRRPDSSQQIALITHIPHDSQRVPAPWRSQILLDDAALAVELLKITDSHTEALFATASLSRGGTAFINRLSRLVFDPERFESDELESMAAKGMGAVYLKTSGGGALRHSDFSPTERSMIIEKLFRPYAAAFEECVSRMLASQDRCLIIDGHSFPSAPLPYEDPTLARPDLCLGFDEYHASEVLIGALERIAVRAGWSVGLNVPFSGSYVPISRFRSDRRVTAIMIEVNRGRYMNERNGERLASFEETVRLIDALTAEALLVEAYRAT